MLRSNRLRTVCERLVGRLEMESGMFRVFVRMLPAEGWEPLVVDEESHWDRLICMGTSTLY